MHDALILEVAHDELASTLMTSITPEAINQRTIPPIRWRATPNPAENRKKWGGFQWHPTEG